MLLFSVCGFALVMVAVAAPRRSDYNEDEYIQQLLREQQIENGDLQQQYYRNDHYPLGHGPYPYVQHSDEQHEGGRQRYSDFVQSQGHPSQVVQNFDHDNFEQQSENQMGQKFVDFDQSHDNFRQVPQVFGKDDFVQVTQDQTGHHVDDFNFAGKIEDYDQQSQNFDHEFTNLHQNQDTNGEIQQQTQDLGKEFTELDHVEKSQLGKVIESLDQQGIQQETQDLSQQFVDVDQSQSQLGKLEDMNEHGIQQETQDMGEEFVHMNPSQEDVQIQQQSQDLNQQFVDFDQSQSQIGKIEDMNQYGVQQETQDLNQQFVDFDQSQSQIGKIEDMNQYGVQQEKQDLGREFKESDLIIEPYDQEGVSMGQQVEDLGQQNLEHETMGKVTDIEQVSQKEDFMDMDQLSIGQKEDLKSFDLTTDSAETALGQQTEFEQFSQKEDNWSQQNNEQESFDDQQKSEDMTVDQKPDDQQISQSTFHGTDKEIEQLFGNENMLQEHENADINDFKQQKELEQFLDDELLTQLQSQQDLGNEQFHQSQNKEDFSLGKFVTQSSENEVISTQFVKPLGHDWDRNNDQHHQFGRHQNAGESASVEQVHSVEQPSQLPEDYHTKPPSFWKKHWGKAKAKAKALVHKIHDTIG